MNPGAVTSYADAAGRIAGAIVLNLLAFTIWNVGTRSPLAIAHAVGASLSRPGALLLGAFAVVIGLIFIAAATVLVLPAIVDISHDFIPFELGTLLIALGLEQLIGNDLRGLVRSRGA